MDEYKDIKMVKQPDDLDVRLFPHQLKSIYDMERLERVRKITYKVDRNVVYDDEFASDDENDDEKKEKVVQKYEDEYTIETKIGILGDIPGYGKSFSIIGLILRDRMDFDEKEQAETEQIISYHNGLIKVHKSSKSRSLNTTVLVASTSIISQWETYFDYTDLAVKTITTHKEVCEINPNRYNVILISPNRWNEFASRFNGYTFKRFIYDEPTSVHIPRMYPIRASFYWFVSATYGTLLHIGRYGSNKHWLKSVFGYIEWNHFQKLVIKNDDKFVKKSFKMPETRYIEHRCHNPNILNVIGNFIDKDALEMINAGDIKKAIVHLGGKTTDGNLIDIVSKRKKNDLELTEMKINYYRNKDENKTEYKKWTDRKEQLEKDLKEIAEKYKNILNEECPVCRCDLEKPVMTPCCQNIFCGECVFSWLKKNNTCPMCRTPLKVGDIVYVNENEEVAEKKEEKEEKEEKDGPLSKSDTIIKIIKDSLKNNPDSKFIIFSSYDETFNIIRRCLKERNMNVLELNGTKAMKDNKLRKFKAGEEKVIFLNSRFNGAGINLEMTTDIILYHEMNIDLKTQIVGRANRMGRKYNLIVHTLI